MEDAPGPAHDKKTGARARDNILDTHKGRERYGEIRRDTERYGEIRRKTKNAQRIIDFRVVVHVLVH